MPIQLVLYIQSSLLVLAVQFLILLNLLNKQELRFADQRLYVEMLCVNMLILLSDMGMWLLEGQSGAFVHALYEWVSAFYFALNPLIGLLWIRYVAFQIYGKENNAIQKNRWTWIPVLINAAFALSSVFVPGSFYIDESNVYHRGPYFLVTFACTFFYSAFAGAFVFVNRKAITRKVFRALMLFPLLPLFGAVIQVLVYGLSTTWSCIALALVILYISIRNQQLHTDYLTGLYNRRQLESFLMEWDKNAPASPKAGILIDLDNFKQINDVYGHAVGDMALEFTADILRKTFGKEDLLARYGGDEFVIITDTADRQELQKLVSRLRANAATFNQQSSVSFSLELSVGYDIFDKSCPMTSHEFLLHIDRLMYQDKKQRKSAAL